MRSVLPFIVVIVALWLRAARADGQEAPLPLELDWRAPAECYTAEMVHAELARIAHVRSGRAPAKLSARVRIVKDGERYRLSLHTEQDGAMGERALSSTDCRALGREVTLVLALAFGEGVELVSAERKNAPDPEVPAERLEPRRAPEPPKPVRSAPTPRAAPVAPARTPRDPARLAVFVGGGVLLRAFPEPAAQAFAGVEIGTRRLRLAPRLSLLPRSDDALARDVDARYDGLGGALAACIVVLPPSLVAACLSGGAMAVRGRSWGASESGSAVAPWYTAGPSIAATWPGDGLVSARLEGSLLVSLNEPRFVVEGLGDAHTISRLTPSFALGVLLRP